MNGYPLKRVFDLIFAAVFIILLSPILLLALLVTWLQDGHDPFYRAQRVARGGGDFTMLKIRSMVRGADQSGVNSTSGNDMRITRVGHLIRRCKLDEVSQFLNVIKGDMSVVGPRPNTRAWGVDLYTSEERRLLSVRPGITDLSSIVFSDEGEILRGEAHADDAYNKIIRPWKSRLGLFYADHANLRMDLHIIWLTAVAIFNKEWALRGVVRILERDGAPSDLIEVSRRNGTIPLIPPPGESQIA